MKRWVFSLAILMLTSFACKKGARQGAEGSHASSAPVAVVFEQEIIGPFLGTHLNQPFGLCRDSSHHIFVVDAGNERILSLDTLLEPSTKPTSQGLKLLGATFVSSDPFGNLFVTDEGQARIIVLDKDLLYVREIELRDDSTEARLGTPSGTVVIGDEVWIADRENHRIYLHEQSMPLLELIESYLEGSEGVQSPERILPDGRGGVLVCDAGNARVALFDSQGNLEEEYKKLGLDYPMSAVWEANRLWVLDGNSGRIAVVDRSGKILARFGPKIPGDRRRLQAPSDILFLGDGRFLISDSGNNRLVLIRAFDS